MAIREEVIRNGRKGSDARSDMHRERTARDSGDNVHTSAQRRVGECDGGRSSKGGARGSAWGH